VFYYDKQIKAKENSLTFKTNKLFLMGSLTTFKPRNKRRTSPILTCYICIHKHSDIKEKGKKHIFLVEIKRYVNSVI